MDCDRARELPPGATDRAKSTKGGKGSRRVVGSCAAAIGGNNAEEEDEGNQDKVFGSAVGSTLVASGAAGGKRRRATSGAVSGARASAKGREKEEVATRGDLGSSSNDRNGEDGVVLSLSAKAETGRPPGRPSVRRARCRQEVGRAGNKVRK
jgi:hypothetical protein